VNVFFVKFNVIVLLKHRLLDVLRKMETSARMKLWLFYPLPSPQPVWRW